MSFAADRHVNGSSLGSVANAITDDILEGAAEQFFGAGDRAFFEGSDADPPGLRTCLEISGPHFVFVTNPVEVVQQIEAFVSSLPERR